MEKGTKRMLVIGGGIALLLVIIYFMTRKTQAPSSTGMLAQLTEAYEPLITKKEEECFEAGLKPVENQDMYLGSYVDFSVHNTGCIGRSGNC
jgi:hypothetical protein